MTNCLKLLAFILYYVYMHICVFDHIFTRPRSFMSIHIYEHMNPDWLIRAVVMPTKHVSNQQTTISLAVVAADVITSLCGGSDCWLVAGGWWCHDDAGLWLGDWCWQHEKSASVQDDEDGHLIYRPGDVIQARCTNSVTFSSNTQKTSASLFQKTLLSPPKGYFLSWVGPRF